MNKKPSPQNPIRHALLRGLAILMPPLLTIVLFIWAWSAIERYILVPSESVVANMLSFAYRDAMPTVPAEAETVTDGSAIRSFEYLSRLYESDGSGEWVGYYSQDYIKEHWLRRRNVLPFFIAVFLLVLYLLGKIFAAGVGRMFVGWFDALIHRLPVISNVYSAVKQVTDFVFSERDIEFNRVVAIEYPRKGIWSVGFVTGESMLDIRSAANEPVLSVLMPTSPMPMTGFTVTVLRSEAIDLNLTIDQAIQFVISCGVVVPLQQQVENPDGVGTMIAQAVAVHTNDNGQKGAEGDSEAPRKIEGARD